MALRFVRRPALPGELNHELVWTLVFVGAAVTVFVWFGLGLGLPECLFFKVTGLPCLGCGGTRCARHLVQFRLMEAFFFHPGFFLLTVIGALWTAYSAAFWLGRGSLRLRLVGTEADWRRLRQAGLGALLLHWVWQYHHLAR